ncbi:MAG: type II secretion system secretin GspD [Pontibacterium sp.]
MKNRYVRGLLNSLTFAVALSTAGTVLAEGFSLDMRGADVQEFIHTIGKLTQKTIIIDNRVKGKVDIQSHKPLSPEELYEVFLTQLGVSGYAVVNAGPDILKVIPKQIAKLEGLEVQNADAISKQSGKRITRIVQVSDVNVDKLVATLRPLVDNKSGVIAAYAGSNVILITDSEANVRRIVKIINEVDHADAQSLEVLKLRNASAPDVERMMSKLLEKQSKDKPGARPVITADSRTNTLIIRADNNTRRYLKRVIRELDGEISSDTNTRVLYLKYANAAEVTEVLQGVGGAILKEGQSTNGKSKTATKSGNIFIEAHDQTNAIVLSGNPRLINDLEDIVKKLDIRRAQVLVEAIIVELSDDKSKELGVQWLFRDGSGSSIPVSSINYPGTSSPGILSIAGAVSDSDTAALNTVAGASGALMGIGRYSATGFSFAALLNALASDTESNVLSTPSLLTMDNEEATILVGREVPVITGSTASSTNTNPFQTIERKDIGVKLKVKPQINDGDTVQLVIEQEVSSLTGLTASDIITNKRVINTSVMVDDKTTIVLGGLMDEDIQESRSKVPLLGDLPVIGKLFSSEGTQKVKRNLMVFIRPTIMRDEQSIAQISQEKYRYMRAKQLAKQARGINLMPAESTEILPAWPQKKSADSPASGYEFPSD